MGAGQAMEAMGFAVPHVVEAPKLDIEAVQIPRQRTAVMIALDPLQSLQAAIQILAVSYQLYTPYLE